MIIFELPNFHQIYVAPLYLRYTDIPPLYPTLQPQSPILYLIFFGNSNQLLSPYHHEQNKKLKKYVHNYYKLREINTYLPQSILFIDCLERKKKNQEKLKLSREQYSWLNLPSKEWDSNFFQKHKAAKQTKNLTKLPNPAPTSGYHP